MLVIADLYEAVWGRKMCWSISRQGSPPRLESLIASSIALGDLESCLAGPLVTLSSTTTTALPAVYTASSPMTAVSVYDLGDFGQGASLCSQVALAQRDASLACCCGDLDPAALSVAIFLRPACLVSSRITLRADDWRVEN